MVVSIGEPAPIPAEGAGTAGLEALRARVAALEAENAALRQARAGPAAGDAARQAGEDRLRRLVEGARDTAIIATDPEGRITTWSPGAANLFGWAEAEALGRDIALVFTPEDRAAGVPGEEMRAARRDGRAADVRWHLRKDGSRFWARGSLVPLRDAAGDAGGFLKVAHDASEQKRAEEALRDGEARLRAAVEGSPFPTMLHADDGEVLALSRSWTELTGYGAEQIPTHFAWFRLAYPGREEEAAAALDAEFAAGRMVSAGEVAVRTNSGAERVWDFRAVPLGRLPDGRRIQMSAAVDVTERRRAEAELRRSERRYRSFVEASAQVVWKVDAAGEVDEPIPAWKRYTGQTSEEARGLGWMDAIRPADRPAVAEAWRRAIAAGTTYEVEYALRRHDGEWRTVLARGVPVRDGAGRVAEWIGTCIDIHDRLAAEAALRESEATLSAVLDALPVGVVIADAQGRIVRDNAANRELWGMAPETAGWEQYGEWVGWWPRTGERIKAHEWAMARALLKGEVVKGELVECEQFGTKRRRFFLNNAAPVRDRAGNIVAGVVAEMDVTESRRTEQALARHRDELERLVEERTAALMRSVEESRRAEEAARQAEKLAALGQLTGSVAHDINNILQVVSSGAHLLKRPAVPEARRSAILEGMIQAGQNARELTGRLLAFARRQPLRPETIDVGARLSGMSELLRQTLGPRIEVATDLAPGLWPVRADPSQLEVAVLNMAVNARDAMPEGGRLTIQARNVALSASAERAAGEYVCIAVKDTGQGIPPHLLARIFEPFFTTKKAGEGTGLGLSQVHGFVTQSGGDIHVESGPGRGSAVFFHLPRAAGAGKEAVVDRGAAHAGTADTPEATAPSALQGVGRTVLVVEDNTDVAAFACSLLEELGYATERAGSAAEALAALAGGARVDAVFSDIVMPGGMSGVELAMALGSSRPEIAVVLATGYGEQLARGSAPEGVETLPKPYRLDELAAALGRAFARRSAAGRGGGATMSFATAGGDD